MRTLEVRSYLDEWIVAYFGELPTEEDHLRDIEREMRGWLHNKVWGAIRDGRSHTVKVLPPLREREGERLALIQRATVRP